MSHHPSPFLLIRWGNMYWPAMIPPLTNVPHNIIQTRPANKDTPIYYFNSSPNSWGWAKLNKKNCIFIGADDGKIPLFREIPVYKKRKKNKSLRQAYFELRSTATGRDISDIEAEEYPNGSPGSTRPNTSKNKTKSSKKSSSKTSTNDRSSFGQSKAGGGYTKSIINQGSQSKSNPFSTGANNMSFGVSESCTYSTGPNSGDLPSADLAGISTFPQNSTGKSLASEDANTRSSIRSVRQKRTLDGSYSVSDVSNNTNTGKRFKSSSCSGSGTTSNNSWDAPPSSTTNSEYSDFEFFYDSSNRIDQALKTEFLNLLGNIHSIATTTEPLFAIPILLEVLTLLKDLPITLALLQETRAGFVINPLRLFGSAGNPVRLSADSLIRKWQHLVYSETKKNTRNTKGSLLANQRSDITPSP